MSVIVDGSTDSAITENEMVYLHTCHKGEVKTNFIKHCQVQCGTATGVVNAIQRLAETVMDYNTFLSKLIAMGSDGASVMLGEKVRSLCPTTGTTALNNQCPLLSTLT